MKYVRTHFYAANCVWALSFSFFFYNSGTTYRNTVDIIVDHDSGFLLTSLVSSQKHSVNFKALSHLFEESGNK
jgi:hypothetical protein